MWPLALHMANASENGTGTETNSRKSCAGTARTDGRSFSGPLRFHVSVRYGFQIPGIALPHVARVHALVGLGRSLVRVSVCIMRAPCAHVSGPVPRAERFARAIPPRSGGAHWLRPPAASGGEENALTPDAAAGWRRAATHRATNAIRAGARCDAATCYNANRDGLFTETPHVRITWRRRSTGHVGRHHRLA